MKGYSTKYALTAGISEVEVGEKPAHDDRMSAVPGYEHLPKYVYTEGGAFTRQQLVSGVTFFLTRAEAEADRRAQARRKLTSLRKQVDKMTKIVAGEA